MSKDPYFSVIIPTYNRSEWISKTIDSVFSQVFKSFEIIVVDDGSTDSTSEILLNKYGDQIKVYSTRNNERGKARNTGSQNATGKYIYFLDSDDILYPDHLKEAYAFIETHNQPEWVFQEYEFLNENGHTKPIEYNRKAPVKSLVTKGNFMSCHGVFLRRDIAAKHPFEEQRKLAGSEDYALWLQLAARYRLYVNHKVTSALVQHADRSVFNFSPASLIERKELMLNIVLKDTKVIASFGDYIPKLKSNTYSYIALHTAMSGSKRISISYFIKSLKEALDSIISRRSLAIIKHLIR